MSVAEGLDPFCLTMNGLLNHAASFRTALVPGMVVTLVDMIPFKVGVGCAEQTGEALW